MTGRLNVLVFTTVFPNAAQPLRGRFVADRIGPLARRVDIRVVSPVAWFRHRLGRGASAASIPVEYPAFYYIPGLLKCCDAFLLFASALGTVRRLHRHYAFDLIDAHFGYPDGVAAVLLARWFRTPVTVTLRGSELELVRFRLRAALLRWAVRRATRVIALSSQLAALARALGAEDDRVEVIENGIDPETFGLRDRTAARSELGVAGDTTLIAAVGHLAAVKRFHVLLEVVARLRTDHPRLRCVIVGGPAPTSGRYPARLAAEIDRLGLRDIVTVTGTVPRDTVARWLNAADLAVLTSEREGSPNAVREALACGCPVVARDVGDVATVVDLSCGFIVDSDATLETWCDRVAEALVRPWDRAAIRRRGVRYTWGDAGVRVVAQWNAAVKAQPRAGGRAAAADVERGEPI